MIEVDSDEERDAVHALEARANKVWCVLGMSRVVVCVFPSSVLTW